jgi:hypothetical protein
MIESRHGTKPCRIFGANETKGVKLMVSILRRVVALVALTVGIGVAAGNAPAAAATTHHAATHASSLRAGTMHTSDWWFT